MKPLPATLEKKTTYSLSITKHQKMGKGFCNKRRQNPQPFNQTMIHFYR